MAVFWQALLRAWKWSVQLWSDGIICIISRSTTDLRNGIRIFLPISLPVSGSWSWIIYSALHEKHLCICLGCCVYINMVIKGTKDLFSLSLKLFWLLSQYDYIICNKRNMAWCSSSDIWPCDKISFEHFFLPIITFFLFALQFKNCKATKLVPLLIIYYYNNNNLLLIQRKYLYEYIQMRLTSYIKIILK